MTIVDNEVKEGLQGAYAANQVGKEVDVPLLRFFVQRSEEG
jgi:hypothetical protein